VIGLQKHIVASFAEVMELLRLGEDNRVYRETNIHEHSSHSHKIFRIHILKHVSESQTLHSVLNLVDLAGSERMSELELSTDLNAETAHTNKSLFTLSYVISKLAETKKHTFHTEILS